MRRNWVLAAIFLLLAGPTAVFAAAFLQLAPAILTISALLAGLAGALATLPPGPALQPRLLAICLLLGLGIVVLGGEGRLFFATDDWIIRDAVLGDLVARAWPIAYERSGESLLLRAPLGLYLAPAALGKLAGPAAATLALVLQNGVLCGLVLYCFAEREKAEQRFLVLGVFLLFSGLDVIPWAIDALKGKEIDPHINLGYTYGRAEYVSHLTQMFWAPHHSLAGWSFVAGFFAWRAGHLPAPTLAALLALGLFWSPLSAIGAAPFLALAIAVDYAKGRLRGSSLVAAGCCGLACLPAVAYMSADAGAVARGWMFSEPEFLANYIKLIFFELVPFVLFLATARRFLREEAGAFDRMSAVEFGLIVALLLAFPLYWINFTNDFTMRAAIPPLAMLALLVGREFARCWRDGFGDRRWIVPVLLVAAITPLGEITRALVIPARPASTCNLLDAWDTGPWRMWPLSAYLADPKSFAALPALWRPPAKVLRAENRVCPHEPPGT